jgi:hypothetical protein
MAKQRITRSALTCITSLKAKRLIIFLTPGHDFRSGGILSIGSLFQESAALKDIHNATVALCTVPGDPFLLKYTWFENRNYILDLESLLRCCRHLEYLQLHIPEYTVNQVLTWLTRVFPRLRRQVDDIHFNILLQNIDLVRGQNVRGLRQFGMVSCTTAHESYASSETRDALGIPVHRLGCYHGPELFSPLGYKDKLPLLVVSNDEHPLKQLILNKISKAHPQLQIQVIENLSYESYKELIRQAKWCLTFGEGLDSYFTEFVYSGGVSFAVFNSRFFTPAFSKLETVYPSWDVLRDKICRDLSRLDEPIGYNRCWHEAFVLLGGLSGTERFRENLRKFYRAEYTFP